MKQFWWLKSKLTLSKLQKNGKCIAPYLTHNIELSVA
jgi:hypothetical protein